MQRELLTISINISGFEFKMHQKAMSVHSGVTVRGTTALACAAPHMLALQLDTIACSADLFLPLLQSHGQT